MPRRAVRRYGGLPPWLVILAAILFFEITVLILIARTNWSSRTKAILSGVWVVFLIGAGVSGASSSGPSSVARSPNQTSSTEQAGLSQAAPSPSANLPVTPTPATPSPTPRAASPAPIQVAPVQTVVTFVNAPITAARGLNATLQAKTAPNTSCSIVVEYKSGPSKAAGLVAKTSDGAGNVAWTWIVGGNTTPGTWPIIVTCGNGSAQTSINVTLE